ncbi:MAG: tautomerase family protein [Paludibacteraceae bacterium]|nr:tautomerase family protein [Paludibacteraceae bacterium]
MPYIKIKSFPKDPKIKQQVVEAINQTFLQFWGCPPEAISISMEEVDPQHWNEVEQNEIQPNADKMFILNGVKNTNSDVRLSVENGTINNEMSI